MLAGWSYGGYLATAIAGRWPASYTVLAGAGHYLPLEQPAAFRALTLAWLDAAFANGPAPPRYRGADQGAGMAP